MVSTPTSPPQSAHTAFQSAQLIPPETRFVDLDPGPEIPFMDYVRLLWGRRWIILGIVITFVILGAAWGSTRPKLYKARAEISVGERSAQIVKNQINFGPNYWELERYVLEQVRILETKRLTSRVVDRLGLATHPALAGSNPAARLRGMINAKRVEETNMVVLSLTSRDPNLASEWLNVFIDEYTAMNIEDNLERTRKVYEVIQSKLDPLRTQLAQSETLLLGFREKEGSLLFSDHEKNVISEQVDTLTTEYAHAKAERIRIETILAALRRIEASNVGEIALPEVMLNAAISQLRQQKNEIEMEITEKSGSLKPGHPVMKDLQSRLYGINELIQDQVKTLTASLETNFEIVKDREQSLLANLRTLKQESVELSRQSLELDRLEREYNQNKAFLEEMLARSKEADISATSAVNNVRIIEPAEPPGGPFSPNVQRIIMLSLVLGLFCGIGLVLGLDFMDQTIRSPDQAERVLGLEVLGLVPEMKEGMNNVGREALQALRTAVILASRTEGGQVLMITSAIPSEGKTMVAFELAKTLARAGSRVLLFDADLRKPRVHKIIEEKNESGLTTLMLGEAELGEVQHHLEDPKGLDVVTTGPLPPNPPELFAKPSFDRLLMKARTNYDWIIIDTPPIASVTDPVICAGHADMALLVVKYAGARHPVIRDAIRQLSRSGVHIAGILLNRFDVQREHYYSQYSYYRYTYTD
ncbi:MAG: polysaccharide biosynthesis tyrosine autokinase [Thermoanaerobaculales bacterium]|nr:polysaccharide biosynthesis tyrosine autokinase [Thermoanaerobaculales bacterium]